MSHDMYSYLREADRPTIQGGTSVERHDTSWEEDSPTYERPEWQRYAACRGMHFTFPNLFFPEKGDVQAVRDAKAICRDCPVRQQCSATGLWEIYGIWGGVAERNRRGMRRQIPKDQRRLSGPIRRAAATCGTTSGYKRHLRKGEKPCALCNAANNRYQNPTGERAKGQHNGTR